MLSTCLVVIPTYNEIENLPVVIERLFAAVPTADLLVVDDGSPDGTGVLAERIASTDSRVSVIHRSGKLGLGSAYLKGFALGLDRGYDVLVEMDADGSHPADSLPSMLAALENGAGLAIGSRWVKGGSVVDWPWHRKLLSVAGNRYVQTILGIDVHDSTAGYRAYRSQTLRGIDLSKVDSLGYCFQVDLTLRTLDAGFEIVEVPIRFVERVHGASKMSGGIVVEAMLRVTGWGLRRRMSRLRSLVPTLSSGRDRRRSTKRDAE